MKKIGNILWGIVLIILGIIFALNAIGITDIDVFFDGWWTLFIIIPCTIGLISESDKTGNLIGIFIGVVLLLSCQDILDFDKIWKLIIPAVLIAVGISFIFKDIFKSKVNDKIRELNDKKNKDDGYSAIFGSQDINFQSKKFDGTDLNAVFGGIKCDLRNSIIDSDKIINAVSIFGGIEVLVPENVKVEIKSTPIFGGVSDNSKRTNVDEKSYTIYVNSTCVFGGVEIK